MIAYSCQCGWIIRTDGPVVVRCGQCGELVTIGDADIEKFYREVPKPKVCRHRGEAIGDMSCSCGQAYRCELLGKLCSNHRPTDNLVTVNFFDGSRREIFDLGDDYQPCNTCEHRPQ